MKIRSGRHFSSIVLGLMVLGLMGSAALRAQSGQTPSNSSSSNAQSNSQSSNSTSSTKKSKKSKSTSDAGGTSGSTAGGGTSGSTAAGSSASKSAAPSVAQSPATADTHAPNNNKTTAAGASAPPSPGMVWVNTSTKVYHKQGSKYAGNTKQGKWMTEADAQKAGYKAASN
jgi:hypothetical protein